MDTVRVVDTTTSYRYKVHFWMVGSHTPSSTKTVSTLDPQLAIELRPDNAECFGFSREHVQQRVIQLVPQGPHSRDVIIGDAEPIPGMYYIDGTVYDVKGLRQFSNSQDLILRMHFAGTDRMVKTRYGIFQPFYRADSVVRI